MTYKCNHCDNIACAGRSWDDGCYHTTPDAIKKRKDANTHGCKEFVKHPQLFQQKTTASESALNSWKTIF